MRKLTVMTLTLGLFLGVNSMAADCHYTSMSQIYKIAEKAKAAGRISESDMQWLSQNQYWPVARAESNNFSCTDARNENGVSLNTILSVLIHVDDIPGNLKSLLLEKNSEIQIR